MLRELGVKQQPRALLAEVGVEVAEVAGAERCCGFGGTFSVKLPEVAVAMADEKLDEFAATGATRLVGCDVSCLMHMGGRARQRGVDLEVCHLAEVLDRR
jgi:L-lactate dehydrogenase complex protein LldE